MDVTNYEITKIHIKDNEFWGYLVDRNYEKHQQLVAIGPIKEIIKKLESLAWHKTQEP